jgi:glucose/arabinose dehydrogenase
VGARTGDPGAAADAAAEVVATGLRTPVGLVAPPDGSGRLFVVEQTGLILILENDEIRPEPFLDLSGRLVTLNREYDERGLLGLAFHPEFATNGRFFVYYGAPLRNGAATGGDHTNTLSEFRVDPSDVNRTDPDSERFVLRFEQPQANHSGGALGFGPDGYLYLGAGDGGGTGDASPGHSPQGNAQDRSKLNGKVLRLDVDVAAGSDDQYEIPSDNPFAPGTGDAGDGRPEIYAYGFRNPWRLAWEPDGARRLLVSDVGYGRYEEVDAVENGANYGWRVREGAHCLDIERPLEEVAECDRTDDLGRSFTDPIIEYTHRGIGIAVVGGYVYRGSAIPALRGRYVFGDYTREFGNEAIGRGTLLIAEPAAEAGATWPLRTLVLRGGDLERFVTGMGEDAAGELYVLVRSEFGPVGETGEILRLAPPG